MPDPQGFVDDADALARSAAGDAAAFAAFVSRHQASVCRFARAFVSRPEDAEDVTQQTFLAAWKGAGGFRGEASARTWLFTIARPAAHRYRLDGDRLPVAELSTDELGTHAGWGGADPEALAVASERRDRLMAAFARLAPEEQQVLTLRDLEGLSGEDTASTLGISLAAMKSRLHRARLVLAAHLSAEVRRVTR